MLIWAITTLRIYYVNTKYNNLLYKILMNKSYKDQLRNNIDAILYNIAKFNNTVAIQYTVYTDKWVQYSFVQYTARVRLKAGSPDIRHTCIVLWFGCLPPVSRH